ncbi:MAG: hypothetical protein DME19_16090 [Verrucomicrobia bacterium]|nr:MAG: hypothetical protein DME19_16090 [Verrucomicrobiota bacterium]
MSGYIRRAWRENRESSTRAAIYHIMNRGDRREPIFQRRAGSETFSGNTAHGYCLMLNHFHLVLETPKPNLVAGMKWFPGTCSSRFNRRHRLFGHLFSGRYKSRVVDGIGNGYPRTVCGRWLSRDPIQEEGGINLYNFVSNNPLTGSDPLGLSSSGGLFWKLVGHYLFGEVRICL